MDADMLATAPNDQNREAYYKNVYPVLSMSADQLIDLNKLGTGKKIIIDSCAWYYKKIFPEHDIMQVEGLSTCKNYKLNKTQADKIFNDINQLKFPDMYCPNSVLIIDHANLLKYRSVTELNQLFNNLTQNIQPKEFHIRMFTTTMNDFRLHDRVKDLINMVPTNYITSQFSYCTPSLTAIYKLKYNYEYCIN